MSDEFMNVSNDLHSIHVMLASLNGNGISHKVIHAHFFSADFSLANGIQTSIIENWVIVYKHGQIYVLMHVS